MLGMHLSCRKCSINIEHEGYVFKPTFPTMMDTSKYFKPCGAMHCVDFNLIVIQVKALFLKHGGVMNTT
jgi:hypothetical protein